MNALEVACVATFIPRIYSCACDYYSNILSNADFRDRSRISQFVISWFYLPRGYWNFSARMSWIMQTWHVCLFDSFGCAILSLQSHMLFSPISEGVVFSALGLSVVIEIVRKVVERLLPLPEGLRTTEIQDTTGIFGEDLIEEALARDFPEGNDGRIFLPTMQWIFSRAVQALSLLTILFSSIITLKDGGGVMITIAACITLLTVEMVFIELTLVSAYIAFSVIPSSFLRLLGPPDNHAAPIARRRLNDYAEPIMPYQLAQHEVCPISLETPQEPYRLLSCTHWFNRSSLEEQLNSSPNPMCPICRDQIQSRNVLNSEQLDLNRQKFHRMQQR